VAQVILDMALSLDGFVSGPNNDDAGLHNYFFAPSPEIASVIEAGIQATGAIIMGRRSYDIGDRFDGFVDTPYKVTHIVLSHAAPNKPAKGNTHFVFVTDGIESALRQARAAAGDRNVVIGGGADTAQQYLRAGLIDEIQLYLVPKLLGQGIRLFDRLGGNQIEMEPARVIAAPDVTHITFRVKSR
jgi:dihydrofolate reductase